MKIGDWKKVNLFTDYKKNHVQNSNSLKNKLPMLLYIYMNILYHIIFVYYTLYKLYILYNVQYIIINIIVL